MSNRRFVRHVSSSSPSFLLKRLGFEVKDRVHDGFDAAGASPFHFTVLAVLDEGVRETQATIADALGYDGATSSGCSTSSRSAD